MKHTLLAIALMGTATSAFAQKEVGAAKRVQTPAHFNVTRENDTIYSSLFDDETTEYVQYGVTDNGGFIFGTNSYGDLSKGRAFFVTGPTTVEEVLFWFGAKYETGAANSGITVNIHAMDGPGFTTPGSAPDATPTNEAPGTILGSVDVPLSDVDTSSTLVFTVAQFPVAVGIGDYFAASFNMENMAEGDSIALISTADGSVEYPEFTWEEWSDGVWYTLPAAGWGGGTFDCDPVIFVVIDADNVGIEDAATFNGMRMSFLNGNPFSGNTLQVAYTLENAARMKCVVADASGRVVFNEEIGSRSAGANNLELNTSSWNAGNYYVTLLADGKPLTKKVSKL